MNCLSFDRQKLVEQLRFALPLKARARPPLIERLRKTISCDAARSNLPVTNIFDAGESLGLMCQLDLTQYCPQTPLSRRSARASRARPQIWARSEVSALSKARRSRIAASLVVCR